MKDIKEKDLPFLNKDDATTKFLLFEKIKHYNTCALNWGYKTRMHYNFQKRIVVPSPTLDYKHNQKCTLKKEILNAYHDKYLYNLGGEIIDNAMSLRYKKHFINKLYYLFIFYIKKYSHTLFV